MDGLMDMVLMVYNRFSTNLQATLANMSPEKWIRLVIIAGTYMLLRPYLIKLGARSQMKSHEEESAQAEQAAKAAISPNELRGQVQIPEDSDSEEEEEAGQTTSTNWGKKARRRQREMIKKMLEAEEQRLRESKEEEEDKDIEEFLIKD